MGLAAAEGVAGVGGGLDDGEALPEAGGAEGGDGGGGGVAGAGGGDAVALGPGLVGHWRIDGGGRGWCISGERKR